MFDASQIPGCDFNERVVIKQVHSSFLNSCAGGSLISITLCYSMLHLFKTPVQHEYSSLGQITLNENVRLYATCFCVTS